jgi:hypothetical protein
VDEVGEGGGLHGLADEVGSTRWAPEVTKTTMKNFFVKILGWGRGGLRIWAPQGSRWERDECSRDHIHKDLGLRGTQTRLRLLVATWRLLGDLATWRLLGGLAKHNLEHEDHHSDTWT